MSSRPNTETIEGVCSSVRADLVAVVMVGLRSASSDSRSKSPVASGASSAAAGAAARVIRMRSWCRNR
jgi:hypothetical protein